MSSVPTPGELSTADGSSVWSQAQEGTGISAGGVPGRQGEVPLIKVEMEVRELGRGGDLGCVEGDVWDEAGR